MPASSPDESPSRPWPPELGIVDTWIGFPAEPSELYAGVRAGAVLKLGDLA
jgi:hypothetical protein